MNYYRHVYKMLRAGSRPVKYDMGNPEHASLPDDYFAYAREIETPVLLTTGEDNNVFTDSNIVCYERLRALGCDQHELKVFPGLRAPGRVHGAGTSPATASRACWSSSAVTPRRRRTAQAAEPAGARGQPR